MAAVCLTVTVVVANAVAVVNVTAAFVVNVTATAAVAVVVVANVTAVTVATVVVVNVAALVNVTAATDLPAAHIIAIVVTVNIAIIAAISSIERSVVVRSGQNLSHGEGWRPQLGHRGPHRGRQSRINEVPLSVPFIMLSPGTSRQ